MMGVADGHGLQGHQVSNFVKINLPKILTNMIQNKPTDRFDNSTKNKRNFLPKIG